MKESIKNHLKKLPVVGSVISLLKGLGGTSSNPYFDEPEKWIETLFDYENVFIVQVGSNDGVTGDPFYKIIMKNKTWKSLFIEPVPLMFEKLKKNYNNDSRFIFENVAINNGGWQSFYFVNEEAKLKIENLPPWFNQLGSFNRENITMHLNGVLEPFIVETKIKGALFKDILDKHQVASIDILHIDTEGYDWKILSQLDFNTHKPTAILFEHKHLLAIEKQESIQYLKSNNYTVYKLGADYLGIYNPRLDLKTITNLRSQGIL